MRSVEPRTDNKKWDKRRKTWCRPKHIFPTFSTVFINLPSLLIVSSIGRRYTCVEAYAPSPLKPCGGPCIPKRYNIARNTKFARLAREIIAFSSVTNTYEHTYILEIRIRSRVPRVANV